MPSNIIIKQSLQQKVILLQDQFRGQYMNQLDLVSFVFIKTDDYFSWPTIIWSNSQLPVQNIGKWFYVTNTDSSL